MKNTSKLFAMLLSGAMVFGSFGTAASAAAADPIDNTAVTSDCAVQLPDSSVLLEGYLRFQAGIKDESSSKLPAASGRVALGEKEQAIYDILCERIDQVVNGELTSTRFNITREELRSRLGPKEDFKRFNFDSIISALMVDHPYELFWYDKTSGVSTKPSSDGQEFAFPVSFDYSRGFLTIDPEKMAPVQNAVKTARGIVNSVDKNWSDYRVLQYFKDKICSLVDYNYEAIDESQEIPYGDPWQLISVFDNDPDTKVVCEGYSKAFKFLCDMYTFNSDVKCNLITGEMKCQSRYGTSSGPHMWNHVSIGGLSYLVDVTNSDSSTIGENGELFFQGADAGYRVTDNSGNLIGFTIKISSAAYIDYNYDPDTIYIYNPDELEIERTPLMLHTIVWQNENGDVLETDELTADGERPVYNGKEPAAAGKKFKGWSPAITDKTVVQRGQKTITYTAQFERTSNTKLYNVEFVMPVEALNRTVEVEEGNTAAVPRDIGAVPGETGKNLGSPDGWYADADFTEPFDFTKPITKDTKIYAGYKRVTRWEDEDGTELCSIEHWFGQIPDYPYDAPVKSRDAQYEYQFADWTVVKGDSQYDGSMLLRAEYNKTLRNFLITWIGNGEVLETADCPYGETPKYHGQTPTKPDNDDVFYTFDGWNADVVPAKRDTTYEAVFKETLKTSLLTITWKNYDGSVLATAEANYGDVVEYTGKQPTRPSDRYYVYTFREFEKLGENEYIARYDETERIYQIKWINWNGDVLYSTEASFDAPVEYVGELPTHPADAVFEYEFAEWEKKIKGDEITYTAIFKAKKTEIVPKRTRVFGDANNDGAIDSNDALLMIRHSIGLDKLKGEDFLFADVDENSVVDTGDAVTTLRYSVGFRDIEKMGQKIEVSDDL